MAEHDLTELGLPQPEDKMAVAEGQLPAEPGESVGDVLEVLDMSLASSDAVEQGFAVVVQRSSSPI